MIALQLCKYISGIHSTFGVQTYSTFSLVPPAMATQSWPPDEKIPNFSELLSKGLYETYSFPVTSYPATLLILSASKVRN